VFKNDILTLQFSSTGKVRNYHSLK